MSSKAQQKLAPSAGFGSLEDFVVNPLDTGDGSFQFDVAHFGREAPYVQEVTCSPGVHAELLQEVQKNQQILTLKHGLRLLTASTSYYPVMQALDFAKSELTAGISKFIRYNCENCEKDFYFPVVKGGKYNPYVAYERSQKSALRSYRMLESFEKVVDIQLPKNPSKDDPLSESSYNKCELSELYLIDLTLTYPKELSNKLIGDKKRLQQVTDKALSLFLKYLTSYLTVQDGSQKELGVLVNTHTWRSEPYDEITGEFLEGDLKHLHQPLKILSCCYNLNRRCFERLAPKLFLPVKTQTKDGSFKIIINLKKFHLEALKKAWAAIIESLLVEEGFSQNSQFDLDGSPIAPKINMFIQFIPLEDKRRVIHALKYQSRSVVVDIANWCNKAELNPSPELIKNLKDILQTALVNKASPRGFWRRFKQRVEEHLCYSEELVEQATELSGDVYLSEKAEAIRAELIERELIKYKSVRSNKSRVCPLCEGDLSLIRFVDYDEVQNKNLLRIELEKGVITRVWRL